MTSNNLREDISKTLIENRKTLSPSSLRTYISLLNSISKKADLKTIDDFTKKMKAIMTVIEPMNVQSKKTILSALFILTNEQEYKEQMLIFCKQTNDNYRKQVVPENRKEAYLTQDEIKEICDKALANLKASPSNDNYVNYLLTVFYGGQYFPVRRAEWALVKTKNFIKEKDNYLDVKGKACYFNVYKTSKTFGLQKVDLPSEVMLIIKKYLKINTTDYLLVNNKGKPFNSSDLSKRLQMIFGNGTGVDVLRSIYISKIYENVPNLEFLQEVATASGHSISSAMAFYSKKDINKKD
jgi:hypothetical protein